MSLLRLLRRPIAALIIACFAAASLPMPGAQAALVGTDEVITQQDSAQARDRLNAFFSRDDVRQEMRTLGVSPDEAMARIQTMSDEEVAHVAGHLDQLPAGQGAIGFVIVVGLLIVVVLLITDIFGVTNVFNFVNKPAR
jgi:hypothetical protein